MFAKQVLKTLRREIDLSDPRAAESPLRNMAGDYARTVLTHRTQKQLMIK